VLVDSERLAVRVEVGILGDLGWEITPEEIVQRFLGISDADYVAQIERHLRITLPDTWLEEMEPRYREAFQRELTAVEGIHAALDALTTAGVTTAVASSGTPEKIRFTLGHAGLLDHFEGRIFSAAEVERGKPAPDLFLHAAATLGVSPARCAVVEDSPAGLEAALAAGMRTIAYAAGLVPVERLALDGVTVISDMSMLAEELLRGSA
jgi:HAD superfamily hydrolase (TIGR01509 family)